MIFFFSGTGNSRYAAHRLAQLTGETAYDLVACLREGRFAFTLRADERIGWVTPVYFWGLPVTVKDFVRRLTVSPSGSHFTYYVATCGNSTGGAHRQMEKLLCAKGMKLHGQYTLRMVDTWTPLFDVSDRGKCQRTEASAELQLQRIGQLVVQRRNGRKSLLRVPYWLARLYHLTYHQKRQTRHFRLLNNRCISCGRCARECPVSAIRLEAGRPVWVKSECALCLHCLHSCPTFAIQYGRHTAGHGQYIHPGVKDLQFFPNHPPLP